MKNILDCRRQAAPLDAQARDALKASDTTILRCAEAGLPVPAEWKEYREALRAVAAGGAGPLPQRPPYPAGT
jgi:hypothetical protein